MFPRWTDYLSTEVENRLAHCRSCKADLSELVNARFRWLNLRYPGKQYEKEDALIYVLELLDCNSQDFDLTTDEYYELCA